VEQQRGTLALLLTTAGHYTCPVEEMWPRDCDCISQGYSGDYREFSVRTNNR